MLTPKLSNFCFRREIEGGEEGRLKDKETDFYIERRVFRWGFGRRRSQLGREFELTRNEF